MAATTGTETKNMRAQILAFFIVNVERPKKHLDGLLGSGNLISAGNLSISAWGRQPL